MAKDPFDHNFESSTGQIALDRAPRVHLEYKVYKGSATEKDQIPFVMGVLAPLRGNRDASAPPADRDFREISSSNFNEEMKRARPTAGIEVDNVLASDGSKLRVELSFESMDDFSPAAVARKVDSLRRLLELRTQLKEVRTRFGAKPQGEKWLTNLMNNPDVLKTIGGK